MRAQWKRMLMVNGLLTWHRKSNDLVHERFVLRFVREGPLLPEPPHLDNLNCQQHLM